MTSKKTKVTKKTNENIMTLPTKCPFEVSLPCVPDPDGKCKGCEWLFKQKAEVVRGTTLYHIKCLWQEKEGIDFGPKV